jgi:hypothetical protein
VYVCVCLCVCGAEPLFALQALNVQGELLALENINEHLSTTLPLLPCLMGNTTVC